MTGLSHSNILVPSLNSDIALTLNVEENSPKKSAFSLTFCEIFLRHFRFLWWAGFYGGFLWWAETSSKFLPTFQKELRLFTNHKEMRHKCFNPYRRVWWVDEAPRRPLLAPAGGEPTALYQLRSARSPRRPGERPQSSAVKHDPQHASLYHGME